ncbi:MAG: uroporphyrinogen-III C-methyltransferase [Cellulomonadaceae bacterium]
MTGPDPLYPLSLRVAGRRTVVVGGGPVAARRARGLIEAGAEVVVVAPFACEDVADDAADGRLTWLRRDYLTGDLDDAWIAHAATGQEAVDALVCADAEEARVWCVRASDAHRSMAWVPAVARTEDVVVAVNAGGDPRRAQRLRDAVAAELQAGSLQVQTGALPLRHSRSAGRAAQGSVALVGGGTGSTDLLTVRARRLLAMADVVVVDRLAPRAVLDELADDVVVVDVGKSAGNHPVPQEEISAQLVQHALAGRRVVRLKGGDPYVFGRGGEELDACRAAGVPVEVVPGVTSAVSVPAAAGIPVTHRGVARAFSVLTGHEDLDGVPAGGDHTLVLLMGVRGLARTCARLVADGRDPGTPVAVVEDGFRAGQRTTVGTLATIADRAAAAGVRPPAVTVVGDVVRRSPHWADAAVPAGPAGPAGSGGTRPVPGTGPRQRRAHDRKDPRERSELLLSGVPMA